MKHDPALSPAAYAVPWIIAWELTRQCPLHCRHCRASASSAPDDKQLTTAQCLQLLDNLAAFARPLLILTGGEPLLRPDIYDIAAYSTRLGLRTVLATCGTLIDAAVIAKLQAAGIQTLSISLDGANASSHDAFRGVAGAYDAAVQAARLARSCRLDFQINTTISQYNLEQLPAILEKAIALQAVTFNPFLLVPTGRAQSLIALELSAAQYEKTLHWLAERHKEARIPIRVTCAPQYQRILRQMGVSPDPHAVGGCLGGKSFAFISHTGTVQICGFLENSAGDLSQHHFDFQTIWTSSAFLKQIRSIAQYEGKCGFCDFNTLCGGCRARAYALTGNVLASEPYCPYHPPIPLA